MPAILTDEAAQELLRLLAMFRGRPADMLAAGRTPLPGGTPAAVHAVRITSTTPVMGMIYAGQIQTRDSGAYADLNATQDCYVHNPSNHALAQFENDGVTPVIYPNGRLMNLQTSDGLPIIAVEWDEDSCRQRLDGTTASIPNFNRGFVQILGKDNGDCLSFFDIDCGETTGVTPGILAPYAGSGTPLGWVLADGSSYSVATYPDLFAAIGYSFGGAGPNFNVPNLTGHAP